MAKETASGRLGDTLRSIRGSTPASDELANPRIAGAAVLLLVALPLLLFLTIVWSIGRTLKGVRKRVSWD